MLSASDKHMYQPGLLYLCLGRMTPDELYRDQASLLEPGIEFHVDPVETFKLDKNQVKTKSGKTYDYDILVIATGSRMVPEMIPGPGRKRRDLLHRGERAQDVQAPAGVPGRQGGDHGRRAAQVPDGAARDHVHAARLLQGPRHPRQGEAALHLSDRPRAQPGERRQVGGARVRPPRHHLRDLVQHEGSRRREEGPAQRRRLGGALRPADRDPRAQGHGGDREEQARPERLDPDQQDAAQHGRAHRTST